MLDLGQALEGFDEEPSCSCPDPRLHRQTCPKNEKKMGTWGKLADLQKQGFKRKPDYPSQVPKMWRDADCYTSGSSWLDVKVGKWEQSRDNEPLNDTTQFTTTFKINPLSTLPSRCAQCKRYMPNGATDATVYCDECLDMRK